MKRLWTRSLLAAIPVTTVLAVGTAPPALAHERRAVGAYQMVVGWGDEPAYSTFKNSVQLMLSEANGDPAVADLGDSLKVELIRGSDKTTAPLEANFRVGSFGTPGDYRAWVTPTRAGPYTFHFTGTIRGQSVDESFTSSQTTFSDVEDVTSIEFPAKDPSAGQLATRLDREVGRLDKRAEALEATARKAGDVHTAQRTATVALVLGAVSVVIAALTLAVAVRGRSAGKDGRAGGDGRRARAEQAGTLTG